MKIYRRSVEKFSFLPISKNSDLNDQNIGPKMTKTLDLNDQNIGSNITKKSNLNNQNIGPKMTKISYLNGRNIGPKWQKIGLKWPKIPPKSNLTICSKMAKKSDLNDQNIKRKKT